MSLTINASPANISNSAAYNVTTSLTEDLTHVNLRTRAEIYHEGVIKATIEKPKGLSDFDFSDILKSLVYGVNLARDTGDMVQAGSIGANLITGWSARSGDSFDVLTTSANTITRAQKISTDDAFVESNDIAVAPGELYVLKADWTNAFGNDPYYYYGITLTKQLYYDYFVTGKSILFMPTTAGTFKLLMGHSAGEFDYSGDFYMFKITTNRSTIGGLLASYFVLFTEVYEDASGVTTTGGTLATKVLRYADAKGDDTAFTEYVMHDNTSRFANKSLRNNITKWFKQTPYEYWLCFFSEYVSLDLSYSKDGAAESNTGIVCGEGWGVVILNIGELFASVNTSLKVYIGNIGASAVYSESLYVYVDNTVIDERSILEFDGLLGGKEYLAFEGMKDISFTTIRNYHQGPGKNNKLIKATGICRQKLETLFKDIANSEYLKSLLVSDDVKRLEASYAAPTEVTVITNDATINKGRELFTNQIEIEYEY